MTEAFFPELFKSFFIAMGVLLGGSLLGGLASFAMGQPLFIEMWRLSNFLRIWAIIAAIGGTFDTVYVFNDSSTYRLKGVSQQLFDAEGRPSATIRSDSGTLNLATNAMIALGKVVLVTAKQCRIESEELHYDPQSRRVWSDVFATFVAGDRRATAQSFNADDQFINVSTRGLNGLLQLLELAQDFRLVESMLLGFHVVS